MKKNPVAREFKLADAYLKQKADEFIDLIDRDILEFTDRATHQPRKPSLPMRAMRWTISHPMNSWKLSK